MIIHLSSPDLYFDKRIERIAEGAGCHARIRWSTPVEVRFALVERPMSDKPASYAAHDNVIRKLLGLDPKARVRTAVAVYDGLDDFENQKAGALS